MYDKLSLLWHGPTPAIPSLVALGGCNIQENLPAEYTTVPTWTPITEKNFLQRN